MGSEASSESNKTTSYNRINDTSNFKQNKPRQNKASLSPIVSERTKARRAARAKAAKAKVAEANKARALEVAEAVKAFKIAEDNTANIKILKGSYKIRQQIAIMNDLHYHRDGEIDEIDALDEIEQYEVEGAAYPGECVVGELD